MQNLGNSQTLGYFKYEIYPQKKKITVLQSIRGLSFVNDGRLSAQT